MKDQELFDDMIFQLLSSLNESKESRENTNNLCNLLIGGQKASLPGSTLLTSMPGESQTLRYISEMSHLMGKWQDMNEGTD